MRTVAIMIVLCVSGPEANSDLRIENGLSLGTHSVTMSEARLKTVYSNS